MSQTTERTIDVSFEIIDISLIKSDVRQNIRTIDVEFIIMNDQNNVNASLTIINRGIDISLNYINLSVNLYDYENADKETSIIIDKLIKGDKGDKSVIRITLQQFDNMIKTQTLDLDSFYFVTNDYDNLRYIYAGDLMIAKSDEDGSFAFPYIFPLTF